PSGLPQPLRPSPCLRKLSTETCFHPQRAPSTIETGSYVWLFRKRRNRFHPQRAPSPIETNGFVRIGFDHSPFPSPAASLNHGDSCFSSHSLPSRLLSTPSGLPQPLRLKTVMRSTTAPFRFHPQRAPSTIETLLSAAGLQATTPVSIPSGL